jgi:hypothetical protein
MPNEDNTQISPLQPGEARDFSKATGSFSGGGGLVSTAADYLRSVQMLPEPPLLHQGPAGRFGNVVQQGQMVGGSFEVPLGWPFRSRVIEAPHDEVEPGEGAADHLEKLWRPVVSVDQRGAVKVRDHPCPTLVPVDLD